MPQLRHLAALAALAVVGSACGGAALDEAPSTVTEDTESTTSSAAAPTAAADEGAGPAEGGAVESVLPFGPSALDDMFNEEFPEPLVDPAQILSGGPPPDGIPSIDDPQFVTIAEADAYLTPGEPVVSLEIDGDARAYPVQILIWHEIVNDTVGGVSVSVTYCPLCNSAVTYVREVRGVETTFGTSGRLFASALVMYDRATESLWTHFDGRAVVGVLAGDHLEPIGSPLVAWGDFKDTYPDGQVLDRDRTGHVRDYGRNPYRGYDDEDAVPFLFRGALDERARAMQRVVGVVIDGAARAWTLDAISGGRAAATNTELGGQSLVILWKAGQSTALEGSEVDAGRDVGSVGVFVPEVDGRELTFVAEGSGLVDEETGSTWDVLGTAVSGPLAGSKLERVPHLDTFWFAWSTYQPGTDFVEEGA